MAQVAALVRPDVAAAPTWSRHPRRRPWRLLGAVMAVLSLPGLHACNGSGSTLDIADAEEEIAEVVDTVAEGLGLEQRQERPLGDRTRCEWVAGQPGASNTVGVSGVPTYDGDPLDRGAQLIVEAGFRLVDSGLPDTVFGRREGMRLTVVLGPDGEVAVDGATDCRPREGR